MLSQLKQFEEQNPSNFAVALLATAFIGGAAIGEELFFRGFVLGVLTRRYGFWIGAVTVSLVFAAVHVQPTALAPIFLLSLLLCWLRHVSGSILPAIVCHASYNGVQVAGWLVAREQPDFKMETDPNKAEIPLAAVIGALILLALFIYLYRKLGRRDQNAANISSF